MFGLGSNGRVVLAVAVAAVAAVSGAQLTKEESTGIDRALSLWNLSVADLGYEKRLIRDPYRLPAVDRALMAPIQGLSETMALQEAARRGAESALETAWRQVQARSKPVRFAASEDWSGLQRVPAACREQVRDAAAAVADAKAMVDLALKVLTPEERADLIRSLPQIAASDDMPPARAGIGKVLPREKAFALVGRIDFGVLEAASKRLVLGLKPIEGRLRAVKVSIPAPIRVKIAGVSVVLAGTGDDKLTVAENELVIDLGGNDSYRGRPGCGIGGCGVLIDLGGDDQFDLGNYAGGFGLLGCGYLSDWGGNDRLFAKSFSWGSALAGVGVFLKEGGHDTYRSVACSQGFAMFGVGLMSDSKGSDRYDSTDNSQGAALTSGVGWLIDSQGSDTYRIGGRIGGAPLAPASWYCFGQGASTGFREDSGGESGGIGLLSDLQGDDVYWGGMYCQGAAYWFGLGALMDDQGNDTYTADYYSQAIAMHFGAGYMVDLAGDDLYTVRTGAMHAIGHDYGVAMLLDRAGNDVYSGRDSRPAKGIANGVGVFLDSAGDDRYMGPPAAASGSRGTGSIALFVDLAGKDEYARGLADGQAFLDGLWGIAADFGPEPVGTAGQSFVVAHIRPKPGSAPLASAEELATVFKKASQWNVGSAQKEVDENIDKLVAMGVPALDWMLKNKLAAAGRLEMRLFQAVLSALGKPGQALVPPYAASQEGDAALNALSLSADYRIAEVEPYLKDALLDSRLRKAAMRAAGAVKAKSQVPQLTLYAEGEDLLLALVAFQALGQIASEESAPTFIRALASSELPIRKTAIRGLAQLPATAVSKAKEMLSGPGSDVRTAIELLGEVGTEESLALVVDQLQSKDPQARIEAVRVLAVKDAVKYRPLLEPLVADADADVRLMAAWAIRKAGAVVPRAG